MNAIDDERSLQEAIDEAVKKGARLQDLVILTGHPIEGPTFWLGIPVRHSKFVTPGKGYLFNERMAVELMKSLRELTGLLP